jgi:hypothetical protein
MFLSLEQKNIKMFIYQEEYLPLHEEKVGGCCVVVPNKHPQPSAFVTVPLINHYTIHLLFYIFSTCTCLDWRNISIPPARDNEDKHLNN